MELRTSNERYVRVGRYLIANEKYFTNNKEVSKKQNANKLENTYVIKIFHMY